jgi:hypothetical protein
MICYFVCLFPGQMAGADLLTGFLVDAGWFHGVHYGLNHRKNIAPKPVFTGGTMKRAILIFTALLWILPVLMPGKKIASFPELLKPQGMVIENDNIYITEETTIYIYSARDFSLIKKFGKPGEGPQEFLRFVQVTPLKDNLLINSMGKISFYTKDGNYIKEIKSSGGINFLFQPLGDKYVARGVGLEDNTRFESINLFDSELKKIKTLLKKESDTQPTKGVIRLLHSTLQFLTFADRLYVVDGSEFEIKVFDKNAEPLMTIKRDYQRVKFGQEDKEKIFKEIQSDPRQNQFFDAIKKMSVFPDYYPAIVALFQRDDFIYVMTFKRQGNKYEFFIFNANGDFVKQIFIPFAFRTALTPFPFSIKDNRLFQLVENEDTEVWELHRSEIN